VTALTRDERHELEAFVYLEARLADESDYERWEALLADDMHYWVPFGRADYDPTLRMSYINDNRGRVNTRLNQLRTGTRHAQSPPSPMRRLLSNIEATKHGSSYQVAANFVLYEHAVQATHSLRIWAGRVTYGIRRSTEGLRMHSKIVELVNSTESLPSMAFII
jgi:benzoate/toluate 1,2-dioxygenase subunit beta